MSTPQRPPNSPPKAANDDASVIHLNQRNAKKQSTARRDVSLGELNDDQLVRYLGSAQRVADDHTHPKRADARRAIPSIEAELQRRTIALGTSSAAGIED